jgi:glycosyltransferase involved in cell wall biosynthesis
MTLRLATVASYYPPFVGGVASHVHALAQELAVLGVESHIITRQWGSQPGTVTVERESECVTIYRIAATQQRWQASSSFVARTVALIRDIKPHLQHAHELLLPTTAALLAKHVSGRRVVVSVHSSGPELGECARLQRAALGPQRIPYVLGNVDHFVAVSSAVDADFEAMGVQGARRTVIPNGVDMQRFRPVSPSERANLRNRLGLPDGVLSIYTGRLVSEKRILPLAESWRHVRQKHPDAWLILVGGGDQMEELQGLQAPGLWLAGSQSDVVPYLQAADLFVLPSAAEGFSLSTLEGLACGLPVVATNVGAIPQLVVDGEMGRIVPPEDMPAFVKALCDLLDQRAEWGSMGAAARRHVAEAYSTSSMAQRLLALYQNVLSNK